MPISPVAVVVCTLFTVYAMSSRLFVPPALSSDPMHQRMGAVNTALLIITWDAIQISSIVAMRGRLLFACACEVRMNVLNRKRCIYTSVFSVISRCSATSPSPPSTASWHRFILHFLFLFSLLHLTSPFSRTIYNGPRIQPRSYPRRC